MEESTLKYVVIAVVAFALLFLFLQYFAPLYFWREEPTEAVESQLERAETQLGHFTSEDTYFPAGFVVQATAYESVNRSIVFSCNSELHCCGEGEDCGKAIEWDNAGERRYFSFSAQKPVAVSARCRHEDLYICKVFIGEKPAQVKIKELDLETTELDLAETESLKVSFEAENTGGKDMAAVEAIARLYKLKSRPETGIEPERELVEEFSVEFGLEQGEEHSGKIEVKITENGKFQLEIILQEKTDETNYELQSFDVTAFGKIETEGCVAGKVEVLELEKCVYLLPCECKSIVECETMWRGLLEIPIEEDFELVSADDEKEEIVLKYSAEYEIPEWCDPETMECEGQCFEAPEPVCTISPCINDLENCVVWLPCECEHGASFQKCIGLWTERLGSGDFKTSTYNGKNMLYVPGTTRQIPNICYDECGGAIKGWISCCELPAIDSCGGSDCEEPVQPEQPEPPPQDCEPKMQGCINKAAECLQVFPCTCASYEQCKGFWEATIRSWGYDRVPAFVPYNYGGNTVPAVMGNKCAEDEECGDAVDGCVFGLLAKEKCH